MSKKEWEKSPGFARARVCVCVCVFAFVCFLPLKQQTIPTVVPRNQQLVSHLKSEKRKKNF